VSCDRYGSELMDLALGAAVPPEVETHAASCPSCGKKLARMREQVSLMDEELCLGGAAVPGPHFQSRVRARLAAERSARPAGMRFLFPAAAGLAAVVLGLLLLRRPAAERPVETASGASPRPTAAETAAAPPPSALPVRPAPAPRTARPQPPSQAVLADPAEGAALAVLAARLDSGRTRPESLRMPEAESDEMKEIAIAPLDVRPLEAAPAPENSTERSPS
jgi:hypothetical protein